MSLSVLLLAATMPAALGDPAQEARGQSLDREIRCVQCENEPIAQSTAEIATDMRALVRERIEAGDSDEEIRWAGRGCSPSWRAAVGEAPQPRNSPPKKVNDKGRTKAAFRRPSC